MEVNSYIENIAEGKEVQVEITLLLSSNTSLEILRHAAQEVAKTNKYGVPNKEAEVQVSGINRDDIKVQIACWTLGEHYENTEDHMYEDLNRVFQKRNIELAKERRKDKVVRSKKIRYKGYISFVPYFF